MARIKQLTDVTDIDEEFHHIVKEIIGSRGRISGPFSVLLHSPEIAGRAAHLGEFIRFESTLNDDIRELAIIGAAKETNCDYEWSGHVELARNAGVPEDVIDTVRMSGDITSLNHEYQVVISYGREILGKKRVTDETYLAAHKLFGTQGITELTTTYGYYGMLACALNAFEVMPESGKETLSG